MEDLYKKYYFGLKKFISQKIDDEGVVEEMVNDVMLAVMNSEKNYQHKCCQFSWICSIAKHKVIDYYRKKKIKTILWFCIAAVMRWPLVRYYLTNLNPKNIKECSFLGISNCVLAWCSFVNLLGIMFIIYVLLKAAFA